MLTGVVVYPFTAVPEDHPPLPPAPRRNFWQRRVRDPIVAQLTQGITPEKIALTVAVGSAFALFPVLGTTTLICFLIAWALRLNQPIVQLINQALWPVHFPAIFGCIWIGETIFGAPHVHIGIRYLRKMSETVWNDPSLFFHHFGLTVMYAVVAWAIITPFYIAAVYYILLPITREITYLKHKAEKNLPADTPPSPS
ncbi:MAG: hypothetical protein DUW69_000466 [Verrucomicrobia bacterium]|nr:MAG: hypothetical protein DUW69_000466 [Verrucomicrobiota bacterium]